MTHTTLESWIRQEAIPFSVDSPETFNAAVDRVVARLGDTVELLGFGEALHGGEDILRLRNRLFQRLVEAHGYRAIVLESSFVRSRLVNEYGEGRGPATYEDVQDAGFSNRFGQLEANRELVEWMRRYNAAPSHRVPLRFYGCDMPLLAMGVASPRQPIYFALDYLTALDSASGQAYRQRIDALLGEDAAWENPAAMNDPSQSIGASPEAAALRLEVEELITDLRVRRPELVARSDPDRFAEALQHALNARQLLNYHAGMARPLDYGRLLGIRDTIQADNLTYIVERERGRGRVLVFEHNGHLQRGQAVWPWYTYWPAGSQLNVLLGPRYAVIGSAVGVSEENGIGQPEPGTLEARLTALDGPGVFIPTHRGQGLPPSEIAALPVRSGSVKNLGYGPLTAQSFTDFDWLAVLDSTTYSRGWPPLPS